jgi:hypothetical protein
MVFRDSEGGRMEAQEQAAHGERERMINREKRDYAWQLIHRYFSREITSDDLMNGYPRDSGDLAINAIYERLWGYWSDGSNERFATERGFEASALADRCIAFLKSDLEYEWPSFQWFKFSSALLRALRLNQLADKKDRESTFEIQKYGELGVWPFVRKEDYTRLSPYPRGDGPVAM